MIYTAQQIKVGPFILPNRFVMGSMHTGLEGDQDKFNQLAKFYADRASGGAALIITGGFSPNFQGRIQDENCTIDTEEDIIAHKIITSAVHQAGGRILLQLLHAGRYSYHPHQVAPSPQKSPINREIPKELTGMEIMKTIEDYAETTRKALEAGYDGIEIMGSEGYLMSQFLASYTNHRTDEWGGDFENRMRFPIAVTAAVREVLGNKGILSFRMSALELVEGGMSHSEILQFAQALEFVGTDMLSTGIGWHESPVPTIAGTVPHAAFAKAAAAIKQVVSIPVVASNRINLPEVAEAILENGQGDLISMARPFLADSEFVAKALGGKEKEINVCIACNQACLDHYFINQPISCLVNPRAARELEFTNKPAEHSKSVAVVGAGVAGISCALEAAKRGHQVTLFDASDRIGGQLWLAGQVPGKEDYLLAIDGFEAQLSAANVTMKLNNYVTANLLKSQNFDEIVIASGIRPRQLNIPGGDDPRVVGYTEILNGTKVAGENVIVIGGGGIGHDVSIFLSHGKHGNKSKIEAFYSHWGIGEKRNLVPAKRNVTMLKRSEGRFGKTLGKSTGWIVRQELRDFGVKQMGEVSYKCVNENGLEVETSNAVLTLPADTIVVCAGQISDTRLENDLKKQGIDYHIIGGALLADKLDAKRSIDEGARLGNKL